MTARERAQETTAVWIARMMLVAAVVSLLSAVIRGDRVLPLVADVLSLLGIPSHPSLLLVAALTVLSGALRRRLRAAHTVTVVVMGLQVLVNVATLAIIATDQLDAGEVHRLPVIVRTYFEVRLSLPGAALAAAISIVLGRGDRGAPVLPGPTRSRLPTRGDRRARGRNAAGVPDHARPHLGVPRPLARHRRDPGLGAPIDFGVAVPRQIDVLLNGHSGPMWVYSLAGVMAASVLILALMAFWRAGRGDELMTEPEELEVRRLLLEYGEDDSLGYFATRRDKAVIAAPDRRAVVTCRAVGPVSMASADPIGHRDSWRAAVSA
ncbi:hypothetical protein MTP03_19150 [Tsukamurella sp. PLM1]|nr:hypothetical protein MTP03_19150 [Tsukamurella sp. PLM1]